MKRKMKKDSNNFAVWILIAVIVFFTLGSFGGMGNMMGIYGYNFMWFFGWLFMTLVFVALVLLIIWLYNQVTKDTNRK